ncbi:MAG: ThuA domain-containing protein [Mariniblastus sp.]
MRTNRTVLLLSCFFALIISFNGFSVQGAEDEKSHVVIVVGTHHYSPHLSLPPFAEELKRLGFKVTLVMGDGDPEKKTESVLPGIEALDNADVAIFYMRFLNLPDQEWAPIERYIKSGKPVIGLRTANHAFKYPKGHARYEWNDGFGQRVLGTPYVAHQESKTAIEVVEKNLTHPIMTGVTKTKWVSNGKLYLTRLEGGCVPLMLGTGDGKFRLVEKDYGTIRVNQSESDVVAWVWQNEWGANVFATSFGHVGDFAEESFTRMLVNSVCWAVGRPLPGSDEKISTWDIEVPPKEKKSKK